jgi:DNA-binding protein HU-beta
MNQAQLIERIVESNDVASAAAAKRIFDIMDEAIKEALVSGREVTALSVGNFRIKDVAAKPATVGRNPGTGEEIQIPAKPAGKKVSFRISDSVKKALR